MTLLLCGAAIAGTLEEYAAGRGNLRMLLESDMFILTPSYKGNVSLVHHLGPRGKGAPRTRKLHFTAFVPDGSRFGEPDCPKPKLPAIVVATPLESHGYGTVEYAFSESAPSVKSLANCKTLKDLKAAVPDLVRILVEGDDRGGYWFNWFQLADDGQIQVTLLTAEDDAHGNLVSMEIWTGTLPPHK